MHTGEAGRGTAEGPAMQTGTAEGGTSDSGQYTEQSGEDTGQFDEEETDEESAEPEENEPEEEPAEGRPAAPEIPAGALPVELHYLDDLIRYRIAQVLHPDLQRAEPPMPALDLWQLPLGKYIIDNSELTNDDARLLLIAVVHHVQPEFFDHSINGGLRGEGDFPLIGGMRGKNFRGFIPTGQTAVFLLGGADWEHELAYQKLFWADHVLARNKIIWLAEVEPGEPVLSGRIILSQDYVDILLHNKVIAPHHNINFPAKLISTARNREDLVISGTLNRDFDHVLDWVKHKEAVEKRWADGKKGYRCLFHGPSGTGKTFATCILGKETGREVYRIDLSLVVSKFIGETEKNLELIFARAENKDWILFFDEADALFGKRTNIRDAHDKYANQEASYLLQRIEDYDGLVVLATNMKTNIDDSFLRRFDSDLKFSMPNMEERKKIWNKSFPKNAVFAREVMGRVTEGQGTDRPGVDGSGDKGHGVEGPMVEPSGDKRKFYRYVKSRNEEVVQEEPVETSPPVRPPDIPDLVKGYALSGGNIQNVVHYATIRATKRQADEKERALKAGDGAALTDPPLIIYLEDVQNGIKRELAKNGIPYTNKRQRSWDNRQRD